MHECDDGRCRQCSGRLTATHMLLWTYPLDADGRWRRCLVDFAEDIVVACSTCGQQPGGSTQGCGDRFQFVRDNRSDASEQRTVS